MRKASEELAQLLLARIDCIWLQTTEEIQVIDDVQELLASDPRLSNMKLQLWSQTEGLTTLSLDPGARIPEPNQDIITFEDLFTTIREAQLSKDEVNINVWLIRDAHSWIEENNAKRFIRDIKERENFGEYNPLIFISPSLKIPDDVQHLFRVIQYDLPNKEQIKENIESANEYISRMKTLYPDDEYECADEKKLESLTRAMSGLTIKELTMALKESIVKYHKLDLSFLSQHKIELVKKTGVLDYKEPRISLKDIGGNEVLKTWMEEQKQAIFSDKAKAFGVDAPKGYMAVGVPGAGKTALAEAFAGELGIPLLELSVSKIFDKMVGSSEKKISHALEVVKACAPCVLLLDEVEKMFGGIVSSNSSDSGITARVFQTILKFMNDNDSGVYTIMTSNDVSQLPPEFTRSGRLDVMWYFSLPTAKERENIFKIHFSKKGRNPSDIIISEAVKRTENFTGAEIEQSVKNAIRIAFNRYLKDNNEELTINDVISGIEEVIPVAVSSKEKIAALEAYCAERARRTSIKEERPKVSHSFGSGGFSLGI